MDRSNQMARSFLAVVATGLFLRLSFPRSMAGLARRVLRLPADRVTAVGIILAFLIGPTLCHGSPSMPESWFVDEFKYHVSAHGQVSCQDCHPDIIRLLTHPNPGEVMRSRRDFFNSGICFNCHDGDTFKTNLEKGLHGGKPVKKPQDYSNCIACHDPHSQPRLSKKGVSGLETADKVPKFAASAMKKRRRSRGPRVRMPSASNAIKLLIPETVKRLERLPNFAWGVTALRMTFAGTATSVPLIDTAKHVSKGHNRLDCMACHPEAARFEHHRQGLVNCRQCHTPHHEATIHDAHAVVSCQSCHLSEIKPKRDTDTGKVVWEKPTGAVGATQLNIVRPKAGTNSCQRCHYTGNRVAASAMILPAKSVICIPCHASTFSAKDTGSVLALLGFALGLCAVASVWLSGAASHGGAQSTGFAPGFKSIFLPRVVSVLKALFLDGLLQRRLFVRSRSRWLIHGLIFWPFMFRFSWGLVALLGSLALPTQGWVWNMLDKNNPLTAFVFDLTGLMIIAGVVLAVLRKRLTGEAAINGLPDRDWWAVGLLGAIVIVGFILEGARIALTGASGGTHFAFVGWGLGLLWRGTHGLSEIYGYIWYLHALLTGAFLVYLPFSKMFHLIMAPVVIALNAADSSHHRQNRPPHPTS